MNNISLVLLTESQSVPNVVSCPASVKQVAGSADGPIRLKRSTWVRGGGGSDPTYRWGIELYIIWRSISRACEKDGRRLTEWIDIARTHN